MLIRWRRLGIALLATIFVASAAPSQRLNPAPAPAKPELNAPASGHLPAKGAVSTSAKPTPASTASRANQIPGQQFTPAAASAPDLYSPAQAAHDVEVGDFYYRRGDYVGALSRYQGALRHQPNLGDALYGSGRAEYRLGHPEAASRYLRHYLEQLPSGPRAKPARKLLAKVERQLPAPKDATPYR